MNSDDKLFLLDAYALIYRAYYAFIKSPRINSKGFNTSAILGFVNTLEEVLKKENPTHIGVAFDPAGPTFRHEAYEQYKAQREETPEAIRLSVPIIKDIIRAYRIPILEVAGYEADDVIGTLATEAGQQGITTYMMTPDKDYGQLVSENVFMYRPKHTGGFEVMGIEQVKAKFDIQSTQQVIDMLGLMGDASDNIPGVPGIGEKTALALVQKFGSLQGVYEHLDDKAIKPKQREKLEANKELAELSHMLGTIRKDAPIETAPEHYCRTAGDPAAAAQLLAELEMHKLTARWGLDESPAAVAASAETLPEVQPDLLPLAPEGRYDLAQNKDGSWYAVQGDSVYLLDNDRLPSLLDAAGVQLRVFDAKPLYRIALEHGGVGAAIVFDGKLAAYLLNPSASDYQAGQLAAEYAAAPAFACAAAPDAGALSALLDVLSTKLDEQGGHDLLATMELPLARVLADMERIGFAIDADGIRAFGDSLRSELDGILNNIYTAVGYSFNVNSPKQLGEALFDKLGLPPRKKNARGYSTDAETLESLRPYSPVIDEILKYRTYAKLLSTYVDGLLNAEAADGRVHSTFIQTEARTGRISSTEPNLQNIPIRTELGSRLRGYFVAGAGETLVDADYSQIELRILAHITGDEHMQQAFLNGADIHRSTAAKIYHIPESEVTPQLRSASKAINFGIMYGKGAYSLSKDIGVSVKEADAFLKNYLATFPKVSGYMDKTISDARNCGYVSTLFGRRRSLPELASNNHNIRASGERMARNTPIQGTAADVIKLAMVRVWRRLRDEKMESRLILTVHDELIVEAPEAEAAKAAAILQEEMEGCVNYAVPLSTEVHQGKNWVEAH